MPSLPWRRPSPGPASSPITRLVASATHCLFTPPRVCVARAGLCAAPVVTSLRARLRLTALTTSGALVACKWSPQALSQTPKRRVLLWTSPRCVTPYHFEVDEKTMPHLFIKNGFPTVFLSSNTQSSIAPFLHFYIFPFPMTLYGYASVPLPFCSSLRRNTFEQFRAGDRTFSPT